MPPAMEMVASLMAYIPSQRVAAILEGARDGVWFDLLSDARPALICKMRGNIIRAIYAGAQVRLLVSAVRVGDRTVVCCGLQVHDELEHPICVMNALITSPDVSLLERALSTASVRLHCFDEVNHPLLGALCGLNAAEAMQIAEDIASVEPSVLNGPEHADPLCGLSPAQWLAIANQALDHVQTELYRPPTSTRDPAISLFGTAPVSLTVDRPTEIFDVSPTLASGPFRGDDTDEGLFQERALHTLVDTLYPQKAYLSPQVMRGGRYQELTDVLAIGSAHLLVLQSKVTAEFGARRDRPSSRRARTIMNHITDAFGQLEGALRTIRSGCEVCVHSEQCFQIDDGLARLPAHAIVILPEMYAFLDWQELARRAMELSDNERQLALFHVMDVAELAAIADVSPDEGHFHQRLMHRWTVVKDRGTGYVRGRRPLGNG